MPGFDDIIGHDWIKEHYQRAIKQKKISHAYILSGEEGMGKKSLAYAFSLSLFCQKGEDKPCLCCPACKQVISNNHPDLISVSHEKISSIGVDDIREQINDTILIMPYSSSYKIYIIDEAEKMTVQAQNALLKTIEEPPSYAILFLLTSNPESFLPTILSRCVHLKLKPLMDSEIKKYLKEILGISEDRADIYSAFARGNLGKAISVVSSENFQMMYEEMIQLMKNIPVIDISEILEYIHKWKEEKIDIQECLNFILMWYRDVLVFKTTQKKELLIFKEEYPTIRAVGEKSSYIKLGKILDSINEAQMRLNSNVNMELALELMLLVMKEG